jgi:hypothetical protein
MPRTMKDVLIPDSVFDAKHREIRNLVDPYEAECITSLDDPVVGRALCRCLLFDHPELLTAVGIGPLSDEEFAYNHYYRHLMMTRLWMLLHGFNAPFADRDMDLLDAIDHCKQRDWNIVQEIWDAGNAIFNQSEGYKEWRARYYPESAR